MSLAKAFEMTEGKPTRGKGHPPGCDCAWCLKGAKGVLTRASPIIGVKVTEAEKEAYAALCARRETKMSVALRAYILDQLAEESERDPRL